MWYLAAVPFFWRETDVASFVLELLGKPNRLQFYANYIQKLSFKELEKRWSQKFTDSQEKFTNDLSSRYRRFEAIC